MNELTQFLVDHGPPLIFLAVFLEQMGLPLPVVPLLLAAGALSADGKFSPGLGLSITALACLIADSTWFYIGRRRGLKVLGWLCRISLEPDSCVRRTQNLFTTYGLRTLVIAKFVPGLSTVAPPLAGMSGVPISRFLLVDTLGALLYGGSYLALGYVFSGEIEKIAAALAGFAGGLAGLVLALGTLYAAFKFFQRQRILRELRMARITAAELRRKQEEKEDIVIIDLRSRAELKLDPERIPGAVHFEVGEAERRQADLPRDREIIVYCSCPNEITSARVARRLQKKGFAHIRPLLGGLDAWRELRYPVDTASPPVGS